MQFKLIVGEIIDENYKITPKGKELIEQGKVVLTDKLEPFKDSVCKLLQAIYTGAEFKPEDERQTVVLTTNKNFGKKEFQELWGKINLKTIYEVKFDSVQLIQDAKIKIDAQLNIGDRIYEVKTGELVDGTADQMREGSLVREAPNSRYHSKLDNDLFSNAVYDIVGEIENHTNLTRRTIVEILKKISPNKFLLIRKILKSLFLNAVN